jgi:putative tryptophan/tyrosine transport system substrate-binding protein
VTRTGNLVGILETAAPDAGRRALWDIFKARMRDLGHVEGENIDFQTRWADGRQERLAGAAAELVGLNVAVLVTAGTPAAAAASRATADIPIVMATGVGLGTELTVGSRHRNSNVTGISDLPSGVSAKRLQLLGEALSSKGPLAILADRGNPSSLLAVRETQEAARSLGLTVADYWLQSSDEFDNALSAMQHDGMLGFVIAPGAMFFAQRKSLAALALQHRLPSMAVRREYAEAGCLMSYGAPIRDNYRQAAIYVDQILRGAQPAELPVDQPAEFELAVNSRTAEILGLTMPEALLARAEKIRQ